MPLRSTAAMPASFGSYKTAERVSDEVLKSKNNIKPFEERVHNRTYQVNPQS
jgi:hypothetical protein